MNKKKNIIPFRIGLLAIFLICLSISAFALQGNVDTIDSTIDANFTIDFDLNYFLSGDTDLNVYYSTTPGGKENLLINHGDVYTNDQVTCNQDMNYLQVIDTFEDADWTTNPTWGRRDSASYYSGSNPAVHTNYCEGTYCLNLPEDPNTSWVVYEKSITSMHTDTNFESYIAVADTYGAGEDIQTALVLTTELGSSITFGIQEAPGGVYKFSYNVGTGANYVGAAVSADTIYKMVVDYDNNNTINFYAYEYDGTLWSSSTSINVSNGGRINQVTARIFAFVEKNTFSTMDNITYDFNRSTSCNYEVDFDSLPEGDYYIDIDYTAGSDNVLFSSNQFEVKKINTDFNYTRDITNSKLYLYDQTIIANGTPTLWDWSIDDVQVATTQNYIYSTNFLTDLNVCLTSGGPTDTEPFTVTNNGTTLTTGNQGTNNARDFNTTTYVVIDDDAVLDLPSDFSLSAWVYADTISNYPTIIQKSDNDNTGWNFRISTYENGRKPQFVWGDGSADYLTADYNIDVGEWTYLTITKTGTTMTFYINGVASGTETASGTLLTTSNNARIGIKNDLGNGFDGKIEDIYLFPSALSQDEVTNLYNNTRPQVTSYKIHLSDITSDLTYYDNYCEVLSATNQNAPTLVYDINSPVGFTTDFDVNYSFTCEDDDTTINYLLQKYDGTTYTTLYDANITQGTEVSDTETLTTEEATFVFTCTDQWGNTTSTTTDTIYLILFNLINEETGASITDLNIVGVSALTTYTYDGNNSYDYNIYAPESKYFIDTDNVLRFDFTYDDGYDTRISREIDFGLLPDKNIGVCVAPIQSLYPQIFTSSYYTDMVLFNDYAECYNLASSTKFAYGNGLMARAFTINKPYYLYLWVDGVKTLLSTIDGSIENEINLDVLLFNQTDYDFEIATDTVIFKCLEGVTSGVCDQNTLAIYYKSLRADNDSVNLKVYKNTTLIWQYTEEDEPNNFNVNLYYGDLDVNSDDTLKLVLTKTVGETETSTNHWFNLEGQSFSGTLDGSLALIFSFLLLFVGLTLVAYRYAFGWFGIILCFMGIGLLSLAPGFWYIQFMQVIFVIIAVFISIIYAQQTKAVN